MFCLDSRFLRLVLHVKLNVPQGFGVVVIVVNTPIDLKMYFSVLNWFILTRTIQEVLMKITTKCVNSMILISFTADLGRYSILLNVKEGERVVKQILNAITLINEDELNNALSKEQENGQA